MHGHLEWVCCQAAGHRIALEARLIRHALALPDGGATPLHLARLSGLGCAPGAAAFPLMRLDMHDGRALCVDGPVEMLRLPVSALHPLPPLLAARHRLCGWRGLLTLRTPATAGGRALPAGIALYFDLACLLAAAPADTEARAAD